MTSPLRTLIDTIRGDAPLEDAEDVVALVLLTEPAGLPDESAALLDRFAARAALPADAGKDADALASAVETYLAKRPPNPAVVARLKSAAQNVVAALGPRAGSVDKALAAVGSSASSSKPLGGGVRPQGTVPAGPFARASLTVP